MKTWFITGSSRGMGRIWTEAALERGDRVAATARNPDSLADLTKRFGDSVLPLALDVTRPEQTQQAIEQAHSHFGRLDVVVNNAGFPLVGTVEEASEEDVRAVFETNFYGTLGVIKAALPILRQQKSGHIIGVSSTLGIIAMPLIGYYSMTKWAVESLHESLALEVNALGIKVTIIEPGAFATEFGTGALQSQPMEVYRPLREGFMKRMATMERGNPQATAAAVLKLVDAENPPLRFMLGCHNLPAAKAAFAERLATWEAWEEVSNTAQGESIRGAHK
jgi:NAD(P)-dependent dehydrogenase (short-subunit alcohol dehydrogenase family)